MPCVIGTCEMLHEAVVPYRDAALLPSQTAGIFGAGRVSVEVAQQGRAFLGAPAFEILGEIAVYIEARRACFGVGVGAGFDAHAALSEAGVGLHGAEGSQRGFEIVTVRISRLGKEWLAVSAVCFRCLYRSHPHVHIGSVRCRGR